MLTRWVGEFTLSDEMLTIKEAAEILKVSPITVRRYIWRGVLPAFRQGPQQIRIRRVDLDELLQPLKSPTDKVRRKAKPQKEKGE